MQVMFTSSDALETRAIMEPELASLFEQGLPFQSAQDIYTPHKYSNIKLLPARRLQRKHNLPFLPASEVCIGSPLNGEYLRLKNAGVLYHHESEGEIIACNYDLNRFFLPSRSRYYVIK